jgi:Rps23 Pro-64 3,4-dihydroxylase Tpa1-like proline 4-hydroxylase
MFGNWIHQIDELRNTFRNGVPYENVTIPNFFSEAVIQQLLEEFPDPTTSDLDWKHYDNPLEQKYALNNFTSLESVKGVFDSLQSDVFVKHIQQLTGMDDLEADPHLHGAGLHAYPNKGKLDIHLDYSIHPLSGKERRVNLIVYLNPNWKASYGGDLQLWNSSMTDCKEFVSPSWNTAILFRTSDMSYHGIPKPIQCPDGEYRKSLAIYYVSNPRPEATKRFKAEFRPHPTQIVDDRLQNLYDIRKSRLITQNDLWEGWRQDGKGWW